MLNRYKQLFDELSITGKTGVLVSGGCDSEVLLRAAVNVLGAANTIAFTAITPFTTDYYTNIVEATTRHLEVKLVKVSLDLMGVSKIAENSPDRCYYCKREIYSTIKTTAQKLDIDKLMDGTNLDDTKEVRPGLKAAKEFGINHPFAAAGMSKAEVRQLGKLLGMPDPERPSDSCLATRIPAGTPITCKQLALVSGMEKPLKPYALGRLRALVSGSNIELQYQTIDRKLIVNNREQLQKLADTAKYQLTVKELT